MSYADMSVRDLAHHCGEETAKFRQQQAYDSHYCFELMRRALLENTSEAFTRVYQVFEPQVQRWVYAHPRFQQTDESVEYFASAAFSSFYFALRGEKFAQFNSVARVLTYLKLCVHSAIAQYIRDQHLEEMLPLLPLDDIREVAHTTDFSDKMQARDLWEYICKLLPNEEDQELANYVFVQGLKPAEIIKLVPGKWRNEREISVALQRIRRILRKDERLKGWISGDDSTD